jgi:dTDP-4-dehydrorhamnose reductase
MICGKSNVVTESSSRPVNFVVGADSTIGRALASDLKSAGVPILGTTRREAERDRTGLIHLDLEDDVCQWQPPCHIGAAVLCAGVTRLEACKRQPDKTRRVNVDSTVELARKLVSKGAFVVFLSTNQVFDGSRAFRQPDEPFSPRTEYGRQKAEAEYLLQEFGESVSVVRFTKVLGPDRTLLGDWAAALKKGEAIEPSADMVFAPIPLSCAVTVLRMVLDRRVGGVLQVSASQDISYADAAFMGADLLGVSRTLVRPVQTSRKLLEDGQIPRNTTLSMERLRSTFGFQPPDIQWTVAKAFLKPEDLSGATRA